MLCEADVACYKVDPTIAKFRFKVNGRANNGAEKSALALLAVRIRLTCRFLSVTDCRM
jgi:hypothetical protein